MTDLNYTLYLPFRGRERCRQPFVGYGQEMSNIAYPPEMNTYIERVTADGGTVVDLGYIFDAFKFLSDNSLSPKAWYSPLFGVKKDGADKVAKLYDLSTNNNDVIQNTADSQPVWTLSQQNGLPGIVFDNTNDILLGTTFSASAYTLAAICKENAVGDYRAYFGNGNMGGNGFSLGNDNSSRRCLLHGGLAWNYADTQTTNVELVIGGYNTETWMRVDGTAKTITTSGFNAPSGGNLSYGAIPIAGYYKSRIMYDAMAFDSSISLAAALALEALWNSKWAIY